MPIEYLCLDDEAPDKMQPIIDRVLEQASDLSIVLEKPQVFADQVEYISGKPIDGLILDLWLDEFPLAPGEYIEYKAAALAQELRTRMAEGKVQSFPIVLWSINKKLERSFLYDDSAKDLFDCVYLKSEVLEHSGRIASELSSVAMAYRQIGKIRQAKRTAWYLMLGLTEESSSFIHPRLQETLASGRFPVHHYARYILKEVVLSPGILISEDILAARLGVDRGKSPDWQKCLGIISEQCGYEGVFSSAWPRWWATLLEKWWRELPDSPAPLRGMKAEDRVSFLKRSTKLRRIEAASPIEAGYSTSFWTICLALKGPLDPIDGVMADRGETKAWQEPSYLSLKSVLDRTAASEGLKINPLERTRIEAIRRQIKNAKARKETV